MEKKMKKLKKGSYNEEKMRSSKINEKEKRKKRRK